MCGICGVFAYGKGDPELDETCLVKMSDAMAHRGPDDAGIYLTPDRRLGLGFRRLSIIDLSSTGHQPMCNEDGNVWIVFNGEIYNHTEHRAKLQQKGHVYRGRSDTETILHLYEEFGCECVHHLRGMFAFAIWDEHKQRLFIARDRIGVKPLYYAQCNGIFMFGSEIKALLAYPNMSREVDEEALYHYLTFMVSPAPLTLFKNIYKLSPGHWLTVDRSGQIQQKQYWEALTAAPLLRLTEDECVEHIRHLLDEAVCLRMMSDVPFGAFLSGGIDSSTNIALMARHSSQPINTFTVGYKDSQASNELVYARQIAREFETNHHEVMIGAQEMLDYMSKLVHTQDEPIADPVCVPLYYVSRLAHDSGVKVVQVGEGADELFCGYPWYLRYIYENLWWQHLNRFIPTQFVQRGYAIAAWGLQGIGRGFGFAEILKRREQRQRPFWGGAIAFSGHSKEELLNRSHWNGHSFDSATFVDKHYCRALELKPDLDILAQMTYLELKQRLPELLLMRVDKVTMSVSLEARVPFLDHHLVEFVLPISMDTKIKNQPKYLLKKAVEGLIPDNIICRRKQGFPAPVKEWFHNISQDVLRHTLIKGPLARRRYFNAEFIDRMLVEQSFGRRNWSTELWVLYNLSLWYAHWIEGTELL